MAGSGGSPQGSGLAVPLATSHAFSFPKFLTVLLLLFCFQSLLYVFELLSGDCAVLIRVTIPVINIMRKGNLGRKMFISAYSL